uniref:Myosin motor domain-containing protein n=1 Tax=Electrophorus electricus TaxID=8005 RepID=A0A4W4HPR7_ELEEL
QVNGAREQVQTCRLSLNDSLERDVRTFLVDEAELHTYDDLTKVNPLTPTIVLKCLQARYGARVFYTRAGCTLVALNPFQPVLDLYSLDVMHKYHAAAQPQDLKPHIFIVAEEAYRNVRGQVEPVNQSLVVSGESGAGKTWTSRCLMKYYATVASQDTVERIERRVLDSNPIMEAFGNARTVRNGNSSRFGKYIQLQLNSSQLLVGASVQTYLLEKTRVAFQAANERNFHIFYQMMKGATEKQRQEWGMQEDQTFAWLPNAEKTLEEDFFQETVEAMASLGIDVDKRAQIFRLLAGILQLGNVRFRPPACSLRKAAALLRVSPDELEERLSVQRLHAGRQGALLKPCSAGECAVRRDCLAKVIYAHLFEWLVTFINGSMCADDASWCTFIGLLDVYGFERFPLNSLEQLCINYANEKLQQHFVTLYLRAQQEEYVSEGMHWSIVRYRDNQDCLDLIEGSPSSIFSLLNEECRLNRASDAERLSKRLQTELSRSSSVSWDKFSTQPHFTVAHYAGDVTYHVHGMMEKNKDPVPPELLNLLQQSEVPLLQSLFAGSGTEGHGPRGPSKVTVVSKFKNSLESLMRILHSTTPHYTRCIKPNADCTPLSFKGEEVMSQLEACGLVETIHISAAGFSIRYRTRACLELLEAHRNRVRSAKAFCVQCCWRRYQRRQRAVRTQRATRIQAAVRAWLARREVRKWHRAASVIQTRWRSWRTWMDTLAKEELDGAEEKCEEEFRPMPPLSHAPREGHPAQPPSVGAPVAVCAWPLGLALACTPHLTLTFTATGFQRLASATAALKIPSRQGEYKVETNQFERGVASIRAQPRGSVKLHARRSPLHYAHTYPGHHHDGVAGFNQILLEQT